MFAFVHRCNSQARLTKGIERPQAFSEAPFLPKGGLVQAMICEAVHKERGGTI